MIFRGVIFPVAFAGEGITIPRVSEGFSFKLQGNH